LVGQNSAGTITKSFWNTTSYGGLGVGYGNSAGVTGKTTIQMEDPSLYANALWDTTVWAYGSGVEGYSRGLAYLKNVTAVADRPIQTTLFADGFGTSANPYTITNWTQLQNINYASDTTLLNKYFTLSNNIDNTTAGYTNSVAGFVPIGTLANKFRGTFDGLGHTIADLFINLPTTNYVGLFGFTNGATIRNIGLVNANITGQNGTGGLAGYALGGTTITNAYATGSVTGGTTVGGLVGGIDGSTITSSYAMVDVIGSGNEVGGLLGAAYTTSSITNSYATGSVKGATSVGGLVGICNGSSSIANSYATGLVTGTTFAGGLVGSFAGAGAVTKSYWDTKTSNQQTSAGGVGAVGKTTEDIMKSSTYAGWLTTIWSFPTAARGATVAGYEAGGGLPYLTSVTRTQDIVTHYETLFQGGMGINGNPYTITNWTQLQNINNSNILNANYYFNLSNDINSATAGYTALASATANTNTGWTPIGNNTTHFKGHFNGQGHTIDGLVINLPSSGFRGFFGVAGSGSTIQNIGLTNIDIHGNIYTGGLVGYNLGSISNAYTTGTVIGQDSVGGLVGDNYSGSISNAYASVSVTGRNSVGGLVGLIEAGSISNAYASGSVTGTGINIGGLVGSKTYGTISNSFWNTQTSGQPTDGVGNGSSTGVTGKTTAELKLFSTFKDAGWDIVTGTSETPTLSMGGAHVWTMLPETVNYTLSDKSNTYKGAAYTLSDLWNASSLFGASHSTWVLGTDYKFLDNSGNVVTGYTNAGTYSNLHIDIIRNGYNEASSGNTAGKLTINPKALTITGLSADNKTYDGTNSVVMTNWGSLAGLVGTETLSLGHGTASFDTATEGNGKTVTAIGYTLSDGTNGGVVGNYLLAANTATTTANITAVSTPPVTPPTPTNQTQTPDVTAIVNGTAITPPVLPNFVPPTPPVQAPQQFSVGGQMVQLVSIPSTDVASQLVGTPEARAMMQGADVGDLKIPLGQNSQIQLVNGGVHLPDGLEQQFFMAQR